MAIDSTMLEFGSATGQCMLRSYGWTEPSITFGYSQKWEWIQANLAGYEGTCIRRITGGGIVDHRHDLTYALSIPPSHPFHRKPALDLYRDVHTQIAEILMDNGIPADLAPCQDKCGEIEAPVASGVCFQAPEPYDVVKPGTPIKLAGAAMKRNQHGVLIQGSLAMLAMPDLDSNTFIIGFSHSLASILQATPVEFTGSLPADVLLREQDRFSSDEWNRKR
jgi:lipoate-protein ligase A